jgi:alpha-glucoside transport system substrate-binding protein
MARLGMRRIGQWAIAGWMALSVVGCRSASPEGGPVTILGSITGEGADTIQQVFEPFTAETGIDVAYVGDAAFATVLPVQVDAGNPPDIALFPQPGLMADLARDGQLIPLDSRLPMAQLRQAYAENWLELGSVDGQVYGLWARADVKSLVWYRPDVFVAAGYEVPQTWDELMALSEAIATDGGVPWCLGMESGTATGWVGTDWIEDILLRSAGPQVYDQWVSRGIPFTAEPVRAAFERFGAIARNPDYVVGGPVGVISTPFGDSPLPLFDDPPGCYLHRQTNFISSFFPDDVQVGEDVAIFLLPSINPDFGQPVLVAGTLFALLNDTPEAQAVMDYLLTSQPHEIWVGLENYVSPHQQVPLSAYNSAIIQQQAEFLDQAEIVRFDASDLMPGEVGTGSFWAGVVNYVGGADLDTVLTTIDEAWPEPMP